LYVNDFACNFSKYHVTGYADDTSLIIKDVPCTETVSTVATDVFLKCKEWFGNQKLLMNENKTCIILFSNNSMQQKLTLNLENSIIESSDHVKFLGFHLDKNLKWNFHIDQLCKKLSSSLFSLRMLKHKIDFGTLRMV
jgi:hypothetical protein